MKMVIVPPPGTYLLQPRAIVAGVATERLLDRRIDEDAFDLWILGGRLDERRMLRRPDRWIDVALVRRNHVCCRHFLAFLPGQFPIRHGRQPDVGVEPN